VPPVDGDHAERPGAIRGGQDGPPESRRVPDPTRKGRDGKPVRREDREFGGKIANLHAELGSLYLALGRNEEAIGEYHRALRVAPGFVDLRVKLAVALRETGRIAEGLGEVERALADHPGLVAGLAQQGILLYLLGKKADARRAWEEALSRDPLNKLVQLYLNTLDRELS